MQSGYDVLTVHSFRHLSDADIEAIQAQVTEDLESLLEKCQEQEW